MGDTRHQPPLVLIESRQGQAAGAGLDFCFDLLGIMYSVFPRRDLMGGDRPIPPCSVPERRDGMIFLHNTPERDLHLVQHKQMSTCEGKEGAACMPGGNIPRRAVVWVALSH